MLARRPGRACPRATPRRRPAPGLLLGIETADCLPVLLVDPRAARGGGRPRRLAGHGGGRRAAGASRPLVAGGSRAGDLIAAARAPGSAPAATRWATSCARRSARTRAPSSVPGPRGKPHLDVRLANVRQLASGRASGRAGSTTSTTARSATPDLYHSFRREGQGAGRMISYVGWRRVGPLFELRALLVEGLVGEAVGVAVLLAPHVAEAARPRSAARSPAASRCSGIMSGCLTL